MSPRSGQRGRWPKGLSREVFVLGLVSLFADVSSELLAPVTPLFLTMVLGASALDVGMVEGFAQATASLVRLFSGRWSDQVRKRKPFIVFGYVAAAVAKPLTGLASTWPQVLAARVLDRFGKGVREAPRDALLTDSVAVETRARSFGWHRLMDTTGAVIGSVLAIPLLVVFDGDLRLIYYLALIPGLCSVALALVIREPLLSPPNDAREKSPEGTARLPRRFQAYLASWAIFSVGNSSDAFLVLRAKSSGYSPIQIVFIYSLHNVVYALASPYLGGLADRWGRKTVLSAGLVVFAVVYAGFAWSAAPGWVLIGLFVVYGLYSAATDGVGKAMAADLLPQSERAYGLGWLGAVTGFGALLASVAAGLLWDRVGPEAAFIFGAVCALFAAGALLMVPARARFGS